jgi:prophage antirepressor-like protein
MTSQSNLNNSLEQVYSHPALGTMRVTEINDQPAFCLADICKILGLGNTSKVKSRLDNSRCYAIDLADIEGIDLLNPRKQVATFVDESNLYRCIIRSRKPCATPFQDWICKEVLPAIRRTGGYMIEQPHESNEELLARALSVAQDTLNRREERLRSLESENLQLSDSNAKLVSCNRHQHEIIGGLTRNITLADMRQRLVQIMRKRSRYTGYWSLLYGEFDKKFHINVAFRMRNAQFKGSQLDYIADKLDMLPELFDLACKLFEGTYDDLIDSWSKTVKSIVQDDE